MAKSAKPIGVIAPAGMKAKAAPIVQMAKKPGPGAIGNLGSWAHPPKGKKK